MKAREIKRTESPLRFRGIAAGSKQDSRKVDTVFRPKTPAISKEFKQDCVGSPTKFCLGGLHAEGLSAACGMVALAAPTTARP